MSNDTSGKARNNSYRHVLDDGRVCHVYDVCGHSVRVFDDFENAMLIDDLYKDELLSSAEKEETLVCMLFVDPQGAIDAYGDEFPDAVAEVLEQAFGITNGAEPAKRVLDWSQDSERIKATLLAAYGLDPEEAMRTHSYRDVCSFIGLSPHESPMGQALFYRIAERPKTTKYNRQQIESFDKARKFYALKTEETIDYQDANARATAAFDAIAKGAV